MPTIFRPAYRPTAALAQQISFEGDDMMVVHFTDGRVLHVPIIWFPLLHETTPDQRAEVEIGAGGLSLHWPEIDEDILVAGLLAGGR